MSDRRLRTQWTETKERKLRSACGVAHTREERSRSGCLFVSFHSATYHCKECTRATMSDRGSPSDTHCAVRMFGRSGDSGTNVNIHIGMFFSVMPILSTFHSCRVRRSIVTLLRLLGGPIQGPTPSVDFGYSSPSSTAHHSSTYAVNTAFTMALCRMAMSPPPTDLPNAKRPRTSSCSPSSDVVVTEIISPQVAAESLVQQLSHHAQQPVSSFPAPLPSPRTQRSMMLLEQETHEVRLRIGEKEMEGKGTAKSYPRQVCNYQTWFDAAQACTVEKDPTRVVIPAFPITAAKTAMFLHHESTREKVGDSPRHADGAYILDHSTGGAAGPILLRVPRWASHTLPRSSMPWRSTGSTTSTSTRRAMRHVCLCERTLASVRLSPPQSTTNPVGWRNPRQSRQQEQHPVSPTLPARDETPLNDSMRCTADSYTEEELRRCSLWALTDFSGAQSIFVGLRDRAMLLFSSTTAFRGENSRMLQWSDLFRMAVPLEQSAKVEVCRFRAPCCESVR
jgi:hypothetical protein